MTKTYHIMRVGADFSDWSIVPRAEIAEYGWMDNDYAPEAWGQIVYEEGFGFRVRMSCREENPRTTYMNENDAVCRDSCLEFFADYDPEGKSGYINCEANSRGTLLCAYGESIGTRTSLKDMNLPRPAITPFQKDGCWGYELAIPAALLERIYGRREWKSGSVIRGNFYKCGNDCEYEHYGMWNRVGTERPNFHTPAFFGDLVLD